MIFDLIKHANGDEAVSYKGKQIAIFPKSIYGKLAGKVANLWTRAYFEGRDDHREFGTFVPVEEMMGSEDRKKTYEGLDLF